MMHSKFSSFRGTQWTVCEPISSLMIHNPPRSVSTPKPARLSPQLNEQPVQASARDRTYATAGPHYTHVALHPFNKSKRMRSGLDLGMPSTRQLCEQKCPSDTPPLISHRHRPSLSALGLLTASSAAQVWLAGIWQPVSTARFKASGLVHSSVCFVSSLLTLSERREVGREGVSA